ncbi:AAA family ATPase [Neiella marina]|uniref:AAA family ATPase n=1 Tax=Neiella holothuriorum TaxID=2870530 RepID=A0ABS7EGF2_9GAMM|nr:AAA family ATPase [Neiella holothuriorum]MBW8191279.1 AAA family ATPase [Neiella holothuriorum]
MTTTNTAENTVVSIPSQSAIDYNQMEIVDAAVIFPELGYQEGKRKLQRRKHRHPNCVKSNPLYIPEQELFERVMAWWNFGKRLKPFGVHGETGTGKTELMLYIADRLNEPVYLEKITTGMTTEKFEGDRELVVNESGDQVTTRNYSNAAMGYMHGGLVILDEVDKANDDLQTALHLFLERKPWTLSTFKQTAHCHPNCRIVATANTMGEGGHERYLTSQRMDSALRARFGWEMAHFPESAHELEILKKCFPKLPSIMRMKMVKLANAFRDALLGPNRDGDIDNPISCVFSPRTIVHWGEMMMAYGLNRTPMDSLKFAFWGSVDPEDYVDANGIIQRIWGDDINKKLGVLLKELADASSKK